MTDTDWQAATDPTPMLEYLRGKASDRKLRLFAVACCRRVGDYLEGAGVRHALEMAERFAEGLTSRVQLREALASALEGSASPSGASPAAYASQAARYAGDSSAWRAAEGAARLAQLAACPARRVARGERELARRGQAELLRDVFGNPFRPRTGIERAVRAWDGGAVGKIAAAIYDGRHFQELPILADALEDAGCTSVEILAHCRTGEEHVRGCWAVDCILGKG